MGISILKKIKKKFYLISSSSLSCLMTPPYHPNPLIRTAVLKNESAQHPSANFLELTFSILCVYVQLKNDEGKSNFANPKIVHVNLH